MTPERFFDKKSFNCFSLMNTEPTGSHYNPDSVPVRNLKSRHEKNKPSGLPFVVDWQIDEQENYLGTTQ